MLKWLGNRLSRVLHFWGNRLGHCGCVVWPMLLAIGWGVLLLLRPWLSSGLAWIIAGVLAAAVALVAVFALFLTIAVRTRRQYEAGIRNSAARSEAEKAEKLKGAGGGTGPG